MGRLINIDPQALTPPHEPRMTALVEELAEDMQEVGWQGRPLLVFRRNNGSYVAWTGSHRIAAARVVGLKTIPCYVLLESSLIKHGYDADDGILDYERLEMIRKIGDSRATELMWQEGRL